MEPYLVLDNIKVQHQSRNIIDIEKFYLHKGEVLGLIGENGAGKSTLLRVLALLQQPANGRVFQKLAANLHEARKKISLVFQDSLLFRGTVYANVSYPLSLRKFSKEEIQTRSNKILSDFSIAHLAGADVVTLSGGEAKRVCFARALVYNPSVLLLDEPFNNLDLKIRRNLEKNLFTYIKAQGITTVFVSHDIEELVRYCNSLAVMHQGKIVQYNSVSEVLKSPASRKVADILGQNSFIMAEVKSMSEELAIVKVAEHEFSVARQFPGKLSNGQKVLLSLRPEDIFISNNGAFKNSSVRNSFKARIADIEQTRSVCRLKLESNFLSEAIVTKQSVEELELYEGKQVVAGFKATAAKLLSR